jgi:hypothetical protein
MPLALGHPFAVELRDRFDEVVVVEQDRTIGPMVPATEGLFVVSFGA